MTQRLGTPGGPILAGDIGATNTRLGLFTRRGAAMTTVLRRDYVNREHHDLASIVGDFLEAARQRPIAACFGVAGPVEEGRSRLTNIDWLVDEAQLGRTLGIARVVLVNDLAAIAAGIVHLASDDFAILNAGTRPWAKDSMAIVAPGTGLGEAATWWDGARHHPIASEAGHAEFAAVSHEELALLSHLQAKFGHVSWERVLSGAGIAEICAFLAQARNLALPDGWADAPEEQRPALISALALRGQTLCAATLDLYCAALAREAGNAALRHMARGGVALAGGIPAKILPFLLRADFIDRFAGKGRFEKMLRGLPLRVVISGDAGLLGAVHLADVARR